MPWIGDVLYRCARHYGRAETDEQFEIARFVLAECLIRRFIGGVPRVPIRVSKAAFEEQTWLDVVEAALAVCHADPIFYGDDITVPLLKLQDVGEAWAQQAKWVPEPWREKLTFRS